MLMFEIRDKHYYGLWSPRSRIITIGDYSGVFYDSLQVTSNITGNTLEFKLDYELSVENDFWDGEMMVYRGPDGITLKLCRFDL